jgi:hypothetical protein
MSHGSVDSPERNGADGALGCHERMGRTSRLCAKGAKGTPNICATRARGDKNRECGVRLGVFSNRMPFCRVAPRVLPAGVEWCKRRCFCGPGNGAVADRRLKGRRHDEPGERPTSDAMGRAGNCRDAGRSVEAFVEAWPVLEGLFLHKSPIIRGWYRWRDSNPHLQTRPSCLQRDVPFLAGGNSPPRAGRA